MSRKALIAGNWKMHTTVVDACKLAKKISEACGNLTDREVLLAPPFTVLSEVSHVLQNTPILLAGQNVCWEESGAFTGEISPHMIQDAGGSAAIIGHSERRHIFHEDDSMINKRMRGALAFGLTAILCIGETLKTREDGKTFDVLREQVVKGLDGVSDVDVPRLVVAYEPVWAIGTGKTASKEQAQEAHSFIRGLLTELYEKDLADSVRILYGGSVKPDNVDDLMAQADIDGALVGGAALSSESFGRIINFNK